MRSATRPGGIGRGLDRWYGAPRRAKNGVSATPRITWVIRTPRLLEQSRCRTRRLDSMSLLGPWRGGAGERVFNRLVAIPGLYDGLHFARLRTGSRLAVISTRTTVTSFLAVLFDDTYWPPRPLVAEVGPELFPSTLRHDVPPVISQPALTGTPIEPAAGCNHGERRVTPGSSGITPVKHRDSTVPRATPDRFRP